MRIWFSQVPAYSRRTETLFDMTYLAAFVAIGAALPLFGAFRGPVRYPVAVVGIWSALVLVSVLVRRVWARKQGVPFVPARDRRAQRLAWEKKPLASTVAERFCQGLLFGLAALQATGHPFWESNAFGWTVIISMGIFWVTADLMMRL